MRPFRRVRCRSLVTAAAALALPFLPLEPRLQPHAAAFSSTRSQFAGLRVAIDPVTRQRYLPEGQDVPQLTPQLRGALQRSAAGPTIVQRADGSKYVDLHDRFLCGIGVRVVDGRAQRVCTDLLHAGNAAERLHALEAAPATAAAVEAEVH